jgi:hypothetical protein
MVRFDSALATKIFRLPVEEAFARCTVDLGDTGQAMQRRNFWRWCMKRLVIIKKLQFSSLDSEDILVLEKMLQQLMLPFTGTAVRQLTRWVSWLQF